MGKIYRFFGRIKKILQVPIFYQKRITKDIIKNIYDTYIYQRLLILINIETTAKQRYLRKGERGGGDSGYFVQLQQMSLLVSSLPTED